MSYKNSKDLFIIYNVTSECSLLLKSEPWKEWFFGYVGDYIYEFKIELWGSLYSKSFSTKFNFEPYRVMVNRGKVVHVRFEHDVFINVEIYKCNQLFFSRYKRKLLGSLDLQIFD